jgi:hypothetical protein
MISERRTRARIIRVLAAVLAVASIAGCQPGPPAAEPGAATPSTAAGGDAPTIWREFVACARAHDRAWPDPVFEDGQGAPSFPEVDGFDVKSAFEDVRADCGSILDRLPPAANPFAAQPVTAAQLEIVRRYSQCMREHPGMEDFPDPDAGGSLHIPDHLQRPPLLDQQNAARNVCDPILAELQR